MANQTQVIESTTDYDIFKKLKGNRVLDKSHISTLEKSILEENHLEFNPILINSDFYVIDGQHRLQAAKNLGLPIFYRINPRLNSDSMRLLNKQKSWVLNDYFNLFYSEGFSDYIKLNDFMSKEDLKLNISLQILHSNRTQDFFNEFKEGFYKFPTPEEFNEVLILKSQIKETIEYIKKKTSGNKAYLDKVTFYGALVDFFNLKSFDYQTFFNKLPYGIERIHPCMRQLSYLAIFKDIYNFKNKNNKIDSDEIFAIKT